MSLLRPSQLAMVQTIARRGMKTDVTIKRPTFASDALGDDATDAAPVTVATVKGWLHSSPTAEPSLDGGNLVTSNTYRLNLPVGTDVQPRDLVEIATTPSNEIQTIQVIEATGGTFKLSFGIAQTSALAFNITAANLQAALQALSTIGAGNATVTLSGGVFLVEFTEDLAGQAVALLVVSNDSLTGDIDDDPRVETAELLRGKSVNTYVVSDTTADETWPAMLNCSLRLRE